MSNVYFDRVKETTTTTGTGTITLLGPVVGFRDFGTTVIDYAATFNYCIENGTDWEVGVGHLADDGVSYQIVRDSVVASSNSNALVNFPAGTKTVFLTQSGAEILDRTYSQITADGTEYKIEGLYASDSGSGGQDMSLLAGDADPATSASGGNLYIEAGQGGAGLGGNVSINAGAATALGDYGSVSIAGKDIALTVLNELQVNADPGTSGQVLTSQGTGTPPVWSTPSAGSTSPLTTKGDVYTYSTADARLAVGTDGHVLTADSAEATGLKWSAPAGGGASYTLEPVRVATTANITLTNTQTIDGVAVVAGNRVLVKNQSTASQNGIYICVSGGSWTRATDFDTGAYLNDGILVPVQLGTVSSGSLWQLVQNGGAIGNSFRFAPANGVQVQGYATGAVSTTALGSNAIAIGKSAAAGGSNSIRICGTDGGSGGSSGSDSIAIGSTMAAGGLAAIAIGRNGGTNGSRAIRIGASASTSSGANSITIGPAASAALSRVISLSSTQADSAIVGFDGMILLQTGNGISQNHGIAFIPQWQQTTTATPAVMGNADFSNNPANNLVLTNSTVYIFDCDIVARENATGDTSAWTLKFAIKRGANAAATALVGTPVLTLIGQDAGAAAWDVSVTADTTNGRPNITVTGEASKTIRWSSNITMTRVTG